MYIYLTPSLELRKACLPVTRLAVVEKNDLLCSHYFSPPSNISPPLELDDSTGTTNMLNLALLQLVAMMEW